MGVTRLVLPGLPAVLFVKDVHILKISVYPMIWHCVCFSSDSHIRVGIARLGLLISPELSNPLFLSLGLTELPCSLDEACCHSDKEPSPVVGKRADDWGTEIQRGRRGRGARGKGKGGEGKGDGAHWVHEMVPKWLA